MEVLFIVPSMSPYLLQECHGALGLATILKSNGISVDVLRYWQADSQLDNFTKLVDSIARNVDEKLPRIVSFYCRCDVYHIILSAAKIIKIRHPDITIIFGGPQSEISAVGTIKSFSYVDFICCGEGENTILPFVKSILSVYPDTSIDGLTFFSKTGAIVQNKLPELISDNYKIDYNYYQLIPQSVIVNSKQATIEVGRGCPFNCSFCSSKTFWKRKFRLREIDNILDEVQYVYETYGIKHFRFEHDIFTADKNRLCNFCERIIERGLPISWRCSSRADTIDFETVLLMKKAGLKSIYFGVETGSERMQHIIHKNLNIEKTKMILQSCVDAGVGVTASFMYGFPQETEDDAKDTLNMICDLLDIGINRAQVHLVDFLQGTELFDEYKDYLVFNGRVSNIATQFGIKNCDFMPNQRDVFSAFFDYPSELRLTLDRIETFVRCYMKFRISMRHMRMHFKGDAMTMYKFFKSVIDGINNLKLIQYDRTEKLGVFSGHELHKRDVEIVSTFYSQFDEDQVKDTLVAFSREMRNGGY